MADVFDKCAAYPVVRGMISAGAYPYFRPIQERLSATEVRVDDRRVLLAGSTDYLGLATDPRVISAAAEAGCGFGASSAGSRPFNGTLVLHEELEHRLAAFLGRPAAVVVTTGFQANLAITALLGRSDAVYADRNNHPSLADAAQLGVSSHRRYQHGDLDQLDRQLGADPDAGKLVVTDGVFGQEGDLADLPGLAAVTRKHRARLLVNGAHDIGLLGANGRGAAEYFGVEDDIDLVTGSLSTCFGSLGGFLAGPAHVVSYVKHRARSILHAASLPPANAAAALAALEIVRTEPERRWRVLDLAEQLHNGLRAAGFDTGASQTPIVPVVVGDSMTCLRFGTELLNEGILTNPLIAPAVPEQRAVIRVLPSAMHTMEQLVRIIATFTAVGRRLGIVADTPPDEFRPVTVARPDRTGRGHLGHIGHMGPGQPGPSQPGPSQPGPGQPGPGQPGPGQPAPGQPAPGQPAPGPDVARHARAGARHGNPEGPCGS